jgi:hypothetical protein
VPPDSNLRPLLHSQHHYLALAQSLSLSIIIAANTPPPLPAAFFLAAGFGFAQEEGLEVVAFQELEEEEGAAFFFAVFFFCLLWTAHAELHAFTRNAKASSSSNHPRLFSYKNEGGNIF